MKAVAIDDYGLANVSFREVPDPVPGRGEVLVRLRAAALNHLDLWTLSGSLPVSHRFPHVLGADGAGEVEHLGEGVKAPAPGTRVIINPGISCGACEFCRSGEQSICTTFRMLGEHISGTFAEYVSVPAANVYPMPDHLSFPEAAALATTAVTAYRMLFTRGRLRPGEWILITGIGGGLAQALLQMAAPVAGRIYVTSSSDEKIEAAVTQGAAAGFNYRDLDVPKEIRRATGNRGVDLVLDSAGGESLDVALRALRKGGRVVNAGATAGATATIDVRRLFWNQLEIIGSTMASAADFSDTIRMVAAAGLRPVIDRVYPLSDAKEALQRLEAGEQSGKIALEIV